MDEETLEVDLDDLPPGYILVKKQDGMLEFVKVESGDELAGDVVVEEANSNELIQEIIDERNAEMEMTEVPEEDIVQEELGIGEIPDIIEEDLDIGSPESIENAETNDMVDFADEAVIFQSNEVHWKTQSPSHTIWRGLIIPSHLPKEEIDRLKARHLLKKLSERVKRNQLKVEVFEKKNNSLRDLISDQRNRMMKMGFHVKDLVRHHNIRKKAHPPPRIPSPLIALEVMNEKERMEYEKLRLNATYDHLRRRLKTLLSGYRRYKKIFVQNHEKMQKGPTQRVNSTAYQKRELQIVQKVNDSESDSDSGSAPKMFKCYHCNYSSHTKNELRTHIESHLNQKNYECCVCPYVNTKITAFLEHMKSHPGAKAFRCSHCDFRTAYPAAVRNHEATHLTVKPYKCTICGFRTIRSDHLRNHMRKHKDERAYQCELCPFNCKYSSGLSKHKKLAHSTGRPTKPSQANRKANLTNESELESDDVDETTEIEIDENGKMLVVRHLRKSNTLDESKPRRSQRQYVKKVMDDYVEGREFDEADLVEDDAEVNFESVKEEATIRNYCESEVLGEKESSDELEAEQFEEAVQSEEEESDEEMSYQRPSGGKDLLNSYVIYQCVFCEFSCEMKQSLMSHLRSHMEYWSFTCRACNFTASCPQDLHTHTETHKNQGEHFCSYCDYVTTSRVKLRKHVDKRHPAGKPLACVYCDYISSSRASMKTHMMCHKSKRVWQCLICNYESMFRSGLKRHLRTHTGERPYCCPHCEFSAIQYSHLTRHLRNNHPDEPIPETRPTSPFVIL